MTLNCQQLDTNKRNLGKKSIYYTLCSLQQHLTLKALCPFFQGLDLSTEQTFLSKIFNIYLISTHQSFDKKIKIGSTYLMLGVQLKISVISNVIFYCRHKKMQKFGLLCKKRKHSRVPSLDSRLGCSLKKDCNNKRTKVLLGCIRYTKSTTVVCKRIGMKSFSRFWKNHPQCRKK